MSRRSFGHIRKLPSGRHQASFVSPNGQRVNAPFTFLTRGDANAWLSGQEVELRTGALPSSLKPVRENSHIFEDYVERDISLQTNSDGSLLRDSTKSLYRRLLRVNLSHFHGDDIRDILAAQISEWWAASISCEKKTTASKAYKLLSAAMTRAVGEKLINANPCMVKGAQSAITGKRISIPSIEEVALIAQKINPRYSKLVLLMAFGGFRFGEVTELRRSDAKRIELEGRAAYEFSVERAVVLIPQESVGSCHKVSMPKSKAGIRKVVVSPLLTPMIDQPLEQVSHSEGLIFPAASGPEKHLRHEVFMNSWRPALERAGLRQGQFSPHCLRHFAGSQLHLAGANIPELKEWLGDSSTAAVMRYVHSTGRTALIASNLAPEFGDHLAA